VSDEPSVPRDRPRRGNPDVPRAPLHVRAITYAAARGGVAYREARRRARRTSGAVWWLLRSRHVELAPYLLGLGWAGGMFAQHWWSAPRYTMAYAAAGIAAGWMTIALALRGLRGPGLYAGAVVSCSLIWASAAVQYGPTALTSLTWAALATGAGVPYWYWLAAFRIRQRELDIKAGKLTAADQPLALAPGHGDPVSASIAEAFAGIGYDGVQIADMQPRANGFSCLVRLAGGSAAEIIDSKVRRSRIEGALGLPHGGLSLGMGATASEIQLVALRHDPLAETLPEHPLLQVEAVDLWQSIPIALTETSDLVRLALMGGSGLLIGGQPGSGKSELLNALVAAAALSDAELWLMDAKLVELAPWASVGHRFVGDDVDEAIAALTEFRDTLSRRYREMLERGLEKVTGQTTAFAPLVLIIDELAEYTDGVTGEQQKQIRQLLRRIISLCRAAGGAVIAATQKPEDRVVPSFIRDLFTSRLALRCGSPEAVNTILGTGWASRGAAANLIPEEHQGLGYLLHETGSLRRIRAFPLPKDHRRQLLARARALHPDRPGAQIIIDGNVLTPGSATALLETSDRPGTAPADTAASAFRTHRYPAGGPAIEPNRLPLWLAFGQLLADAPGGVMVDDLVAVQLPAYTTRTSVVTALRYWERNGWAIATKDGRGNRWRRADLIEEEVEDDRDRPPPEPKDLDLYDDQRHGI
jgi:S-DNA-T family DNA segregation ATPase FtsK/SpoIIIE